MLTMENVPVLILAGGKGTRLQGVINDRPKSLAEVHGRPFLHYLLDEVERHGVRRVVLCTGVMGDQIRQAIGKRYGRLRVSYSHETEPLGTGGAILQALPCIESEHFLVMNGDSYCRCSLTAFCDFSAGCNADAAMVLTSVADKARYGAVRVDSTGRVVAFQEKKEYGPGLINSGVYYFAQNALRRIGLEKGSLSLERDILPRLIAQGLYGFVSPGDFIDIGTESSYREAQSFFTSNGKAYW